MRLSRNIRRMCFAAGIMVLGATASALPLDARILIDRALNSPTITVRYNGANAALVELRLNGASIGTRTVNAGRASGETNFDIDLSSLKDGDNEVEIRLFDRMGKLVGSDKTNISTDQSSRGPVFLAAPKVGATVQGPVEIKVGFGRDLNNTYVSFFVDEQFKSMTNFPPFEYLWDTTTEANGWHEIEAWVVDGTSSTFKTRKVRVFVNNPGGRTNRTGSTVNLNPVTNPINAAITGAVAGVRTGSVTASTKAAGAALKNAVPVVSGSVVGNTVKPVVGQMTGIKPLKAGSVAAAGVRNLTPTGIRVAQTPKVAPTTAVTKVSAATVATQQALVTKAAPKVQTVKTTVPKSAVAAVNTATMLNVTKGTKIPNVATFGVLLNSQVVSFDVQPRVDDGIPMAPLRHLIEKSGGKVDWENLSKSVVASTDGKSIFLQIGEKVAKIDDASVVLELAPYLDRGRTIVPLSFIREAMNVNVEYDKATNHVLITKK